MIFWNLPDFQSFQFSSDEDQPPIACTSSSVVEPDDVNERRHHSESLRKEKKARSIRKAESDCGQSSSIYSGQYDVLEELEVRVTPWRRLKMTPS